MKPVFSALVLGALLHASPGTAFAACVPTRIEVCAANDDEADLWINGTNIGFFPYVNWDSPGTPACITINNPTFLNVAGNNTIGYRVHNTAPGGEIWGSYSIDITCADGTHSYANSSSGAVSQFQVQNDCPGTAPTRASSPEGDGPRPWW
jgi:hypothetical protein